MLADATRVRIILALRDGELSVNHQADVLDADAVDELYTTFGERAWHEIVQNIRKFAGRDGAIIATLSGDANVHCFRERARQGLDAKGLPVMSLSLGEAEMPALHERTLIGHMVSWT